MGLSPSEVVRLGPVLKVFVVGDDRELWETFEVVAPIFKGSNDRHELFVVDFVITLWCVHRLGSVHNGVPQAIVAFLGKYSASGEVGRIDLDYGRSIGIIQRQHECFYEGLLECSERCILIFFLAPERVLLHEVVEWTCLSQEVLNESLIEVCKSEETPDISEVAGLWPVGDGGGFTMVHAYATRFDDHAEVFNAVAVELALLRLQV